MNWLLACLLLLSHALMACDAVRVRVEKDANRMQHGSGAILEPGLIVTCLHVVEDAGTILVEDETGWTICRVLKTDKDFDLAYLEPVRELKPIKRKVDGEHILGAARGEPIAAHDAEITGSKTVLSRGFDHGCSGAPLIKNGELMGIITAGVAFGGGFLLNNRDQKTALFVPASVVMSLKPKK